MLLLVKVFDAVTGILVVAELFLVLLPFQTWLVIPQSPLEHIDYGGSSYFRAEEGATKRRLTFVNGIRRLLEIISTGKRNGHVKVSETNEIWRKVLLLTVDGDFFPLNKNFTASFPGALCQGPGCESRCINGATVSG